MRALDDEPLIKAILEAFPGATIHMTDPTEIEIQGIFHAASKGGEFLDALGKSDLATMTHDEWMSFIEQVVIGFQDKVCELSAPYSSEAPF